MKPAKDNLPQKILVIRNDKLGDFMLAWPAFALLKKQLPKAEITALVPEYTASLAEQCEWIDKVLIDSKPAPVLNNALKLAGSIKKKHYDLSISLFSEFRTALALYLAGVPVRVGPATKLAQLLLNRKLRQKRSQSLKPEYEYNMDLVRFYAESIGKRSDQAVTAPYLKFEKHEIDRLKQDLVKQHALSAEDSIIFIHPGTGGSAINLSVAQFAELAKTIAAVNNIYFVITAGPGELEQAERLSALLQGVRHHIYNSTGTLIDFSKFLNVCDIFISGSTGPLHIAAALNRRTVAFYPARRSATSLRWQTVNDEDRRISFSPEKFTGEHDMQTIDAEACAREIISFYKSSLIK